MRKSNYNFTLTDEHSEILDHYAKILSPEKPNRSLALAVLIDLVNSNFADENVLTHFSAMSELDGRKFRGKQ